MSKLKIVHLNTSGVGGAAIACHRLHDLMLQQGIQSNVIHLYDNCRRKSGCHSIGYSGMRRYTNRLLYTFAQYDLKPEAYVFNEMAPLACGVAHHPLVQEADVIYLHWVQGGFLSKSDFEEIASLGKPVFCFTHDMWWITGACHYVFDCEAYKTGCKQCPLHKRFSFLTRKQAAWKRSYYAKYRNVHLISPSVWLKSCADVSFVVDPERCHVISNVVPDAIFHLIDKQFAKKELGLPLDKIIISFGTADNHNVVKGFTYLQQALNQIKDSRILLCVYGSDYDEELASKIHHPIHFLGRLNDPHQVALANAAADLFVSPTLAESFGLTLLENIKCGTPVISTRTTAVPEIVKEGQTGYLVPPKDAKAIADAIVAFMNKPWHITHDCDEFFSDQFIIAQHLSLIEQVQNQNL